MRRRLVQSIALAVVVCFGGSLSAEAVTFYKHEEVSRGVFIRSAVNAAGLTPTSPEAITVTDYFTRIPRTLAPYVDAAHSEGALAIFGDHLRLSRTITRGEALYVTAMLLDIQEAGNVEYPDVDSGYLGYAVGASLDNDWLPARRSDLFGAHESLKSGEAVVLFRAAFGVNPQLVEQGSVNGPVTAAPADDAPKTLKIKVGSADDVSNLDLSAQAESVHNIWKLLNEYYIDPAALDSEQAFIDAKKALVNSVDDPYTVYLPPVEADEVFKGLDGEITGIGARVEQVNGVLTIVSPLKGSPAEEAGLEPGDQIIKVDGEDITEMEFMDAVFKVRGPKGSPVELTIRRKGGELEFTVVRDVIKVPEVDITWHGSIAVVELYQFGKISDEELPDMLRGLTDQGRPLNGVVLDLRNNPGGYLDSATSVVGNFVPEGTLVASIQLRDGFEEEHTRSTPVFPDLPMAVLVNDGSASASEIVAGALQDHGRATVIGEQTFGKGTVQRLIQMTDGSSLKVTIARWLTPDGSEIDGQGVVPDIEVVKTTDRDEQLIRALNLLR